MVTIDLEVCKVIAVRNGLSLQFVIKEFQVFDILGQITALTKKFEKNFAFKGGTALNTVYFKQIQRFSEDLDFDFNSEALADAKAVANEIAEQIKGFEVGELRRVRKTIMFECAFDSPLGNKDHVRVDIAAKKIITLNQLETNAAVSNYGQSSVSGFYVYSIDDLVARKMNALRDRTEGKDVFDVFHGLPTCKNILGAIEKMLKSEKSDKKTAEFIEETIQAVKKLNIKKASQLTNSFIPSFYRPRSWEELKNSLIVSLENLK